MENLQKNEEATVYVRELGLFVPVKLLNDTQAVLSLEKLCEDHGYSHEWTSGQKPHLIKKWQTNTMQHGELRSASLSLVEQQVLPLPVRPHLHLQHLHCRILEVLHRVQY